jgi:hypothetical protein
MARLVERIIRNFGEKRLTGAVFLDVAKAFDTVWIDGLLYKLKLINFPCYIVHTISSHLKDRTSEASFQTATSSLRVMRAGEAQVGLISPLLFSLNVNDMPSPSHHVELALYADDTAIISTSRKPTLLVSYPESYLNDLQRWLSEWRIVINVSKSTAIIFARAGRRFIHPRTCYTVRGNNRMGRHNSLSGGDPRYTTHLVASHRSGQEEGCPAIGYAGSSPE